jgi:hypothetical protein
MTNAKKGKDSLGLDDWRWSRAKIAMVALLMPIPGFSSLTPIPEPASVELASTVYEKIDYATSADERAAAARAAKVRAYDDQNLDLDKDAVLTTASRPIEVVTIPRDIAEQAPTRSLNAYSSDRPKLNGESPRRISLGGMLAGEQCMFVPIETTSEDDDIALAGASTADVKGLDAKLDKGGMTICNDDERANSLEGRALYVDTISSGA